MEEIDRNLEAADVILLLVSADFISSDYCYNLEMQRALERHNTGDAIVVPIIVRNVDWHDAPFARLQALPRNGKAVTTWDDRDTAWRDVSEGLKRLINEIQGRKGRR